jgi:Vacuolar sorting-associated protein 13, N-terminal
VLGAIHRWPGGLSSSRSGLVSYASGIGVIATLDVHPFEGKHCPCLAVDVTIKNVVFGKCLLAQPSGSFRCTSCSIQQVHVICPWSQLLRLKAARLHIGFEGVAAEAVFQMWPQRRARHAARISDKHRYQIAAVDTLLGRGSNQLQKPSAWRTVLTRASMLAATAVASHVSLTLDYASLNLHCSNACMLQAPDIDSSALLPPSAGQKSCVLTIQRLQLAPASMLRLTLLAADSTSVGTSSLRDACLTALQISGVNLLCREEVPGASRAETHIVKRWAAEVAACKERAASGSPAAATSVPGLDFKVHAQAFVATLDPVALRTVQHFARALRGRRRFARYRAHRPAVAVTDDVGAWWRHAICSVTSHLDEIKQDAPLPISALQYLPDFVASYKPARLQSPRGAHDGHRCA